MNCVKRLIVVSSTLKCTCKHWSHQCPEKRNKILSPKAISPLVTPGAHGTLVILPTRPCTWCCLGTLMPQGCQSQMKKDSRKSKQCLGKDLNEERHQTKTEIMLLVGLILTRLILPRDLTVLYSLWEQRWITPQRGGGINLHDKYHLLLTAMLFWTPLTLPLPHHS